MAPERPINGIRGWSVLFLSMAASLMGSGSGVYIYMQKMGPTQLQQMARPDPATGAELRDVIKKLDRHLYNHPDISNKFDRRIAILETRQSTITRNQQRIMDKLEKFK